MHCPSSHRNSAGEHNPVTISGANKQAYITTQTQGRTNTIKQGYCTTSLYFFSCHNYEKKKEKKEFPFGGGIVHITFLKQIKFKWNFIYFRISVHRICKQHIKGLVLQNAIY
jgi:hypothetical protein